jgi:hypothetical protein
MAFDPPHSPHHLLPSRTAATGFTAESPFAAGDTPGRSADFLGIDDVVDHSPMDIGQAKIATAVVVGESRVIHPQQVQDGRMQVMHMNSIFNRMHP